jgi:hypothetical protein
VEKVFVPPFEGSAVLFRGRDASAVQKWAAQCHGADTGLTAQRRTVAGIALLGESAEQRQGVIPRRVRGVARTCRCESIKWLGRGSRCGGDMPVGALERGGPHPRGALPSSEAGLTRGGGWPSSEADLSRGGDWAERFR